jgi:hypothetical protein
VLRKEHVRSGGGRLAKVCRRSCHIIGAKALKASLGPHAMDVAPPAFVEVAEEAPPAYRWLGVAGRNTGHRSSMTTSRLRPPHSCFR